MKRALATTPQAPAVSSTKGASSRPPTRPAGTCKSRRSPRFLTRSARTCARNRFARFRTWSAPRFRKPAPARCRTPSAKCRRGSSPKSVQGSVRDQDRVRHRPGADSGHGKRHPLRFREGPGLRTLFREREKVEMRGRGRNVPAERALQHLHARQHQLQNVLRQQRLFVADLLELPEHDLPDVHRLDVPVLPGL